MDTNEKILEQRRRERKLMTKWRILMQRQRLIGIAMTLMGVGLLFTEAAGGGLVIAAFGLWALLTKELIITYTSRTRTNHSR